MNNLDRLIKKEIYKEYKKQVLNEEEINLFRNLGNAIYDGFKGASGDLIREYVIKAILSMFNLNSRMSEALSTVLAQYDVRRLLLIFKSSQECNANVPDLVDAILEVIIGQVQYSDKGTNGILKSGARNLFGEVIKKSTVGEEMSKVICEMVWKQ